MTSGSKVLLTGVTGFVGKVVLETLLRRKKELNIDTVYVLIRPKTNRKTGEQMPASERFEKEVASSACFNGLPAQWMNSVKIVAGDLTLKSLGFDQPTQDNLLPELTQIINCAASVEFDMPLADAANSNITSALNVLEFARSCTKLNSFVNVSTAYVSPHPGNGVTVPEKLVDLPFDPQVVYQSILDGTADEKALMTKTGHPNTYTFTKCLSERLLDIHKGDVPLSIVRPSIISASWQHPTPGWIDSYAAFAGFVSLIGSGMLKCAVGTDNTILDIVPCDEVANSVVNTAFWPAAKGERPFIQHVVTGIDRGSRIDTCISGIESYFQRNPVHGWSELKNMSNGKPHRFVHWRHHVLPSTMADAWFRLSRQPKQKQQVKKLLTKIEYVNNAFTYFTHNSFYFATATPLDMQLSDKQYIELVCKGVYENLMKRKAEETNLAGAKHKHPKRDLRWVRKQPNGNWAIRSASYVVRKGLRKCTDLITFDKPSFENAMTKVDPASLLVVIPNHRSYMDFLLCSYLFFSHPELNVPIPQIAAANDFARIPFLGWFFQQTHAFYIQRGQGKEDPQLKEKIQTLVDKNQTLEFFIEGARSRSRQFLKPKRGLLRALQNTGIPCTILPISISYDLVAEENAFMSELRAAPKQGMKLRSLLKWTNRMIAGKVKLGRVHIVCGNPVSMTAQTDVHMVSKAIMQELQDKMVVSNFHLKAFLHHNPIDGIDLEWLQKAIVERGGRIIESPLKDMHMIDPLNERTMRYHWMHYFYPDILALWPDHPVLEHHIRENYYAKDVLQRAEHEFEVNSEHNNLLKNFLREVFEPLAKEYVRILDLAKKSNGQLADAKTLVAQSNNSFLPFVEEVLASLTERGLLAVKDNGYVSGPRWFELNNFYESCHLGEEKVLEAKSA